ncbi:hypothetical protein BH23CHL8_BH23CHL8_29710 [soil metagenome]
MPVPARTSQTADVMRPSRDTHGQRPAGRFVPRFLCLVLLTAALLLPEVALGAGWGPARRVSSQDGARLDSLHQVATSSGALHLTHARLGRGGRADKVIHQRSRDEGRTWSSERALFSSSGPHRHVVPNLAIAARGSTVVVVWRTRGASGWTLFARTSRDGGTTFQARVAVTSTGPSSALGVPAVAVGDAGIAVAWTSRRTGEIKLRRSTDQGRSFGRIRTLGRTGMSIRCRARVTDGLVGLAVAGSRIHVAWSAAAKGRCLAERIVMRSSMDGGRRWSQTRTVTAQQSYGWPELDARGQQVVATVQLPSGGLLVARSGQEGSDWNARVLVPPKGHIRSAGDILSRPGGVVWVAYVDMRIVKGKVVSSRVAARRSADGGRTFGSPSTVLARKRRLRQAPNLATQRDRPTVVVQSGALSGSPRNILAIRWR